MDARSTVRYKSRRFAVRVVRLYQYLSEERREYVLSKQILRCGTSIGANIAEAEYAVSRKDFVSKLYIALKECAETLYWIDLLQEVGYVSEEQGASLMKDCEELRKILASSTKTIVSEGSNMKEE